MVEQVKKVLDENKIKYNSNIKKNEEAEIAIFNISINVNDDKTCPQLIDALIWFSTQERYPFLNISVPIVMEIPSSSRNKIKNYLLEINSRGFIGSFGTEKRSKSISFNFTDILSYSKDGQKIFELAKIPIYIHVIERILQKAITDINKLIPDKSEVGMDI